MMRARLDASFSAVIAVFMTVPVGSTRSAVIRFKPPMDGDDP